MQYFLKRELSVNISGNDILIFTSGKNKHVLLNYQAQDLVVLELLSSSRAYSIKEIIEYFEFTIAEPFDKERLEYTFTFLFESNLLDTYQHRENYIKQIQEEGYSYFDRQLRYFTSLNSSKKEFDAFSCMDKLLKSKVLIFGIGGLGSNVAINLAQSGVGTLILLDKDTVEISNANRTLAFGEDDVGQNKTSALKAYLNKMFKWTNVKTINKNIKCEDDIRDILSRYSDVNIVISAVDTPQEIKYMISDICSELKIPCIRGGYGFEFASIGPIYIPNKSCCQRCADKALYPKSLKFISDSSYLLAPTVNWIAKSIASFLTSEVVGFISKAYETKLTNRMLQFDFEALNIGAVNINYPLYCESCGGWSNVLNHRSPITF